ncbi:MAG TPA: hypothetical protein VKV37_24435 [Ktedonobacteraceae bacterium]|jgi:hypothetical protein|nr:hypothetical protein [Ktedonobacteraceae bacterium]
MIERQTQQFFQKLAPRPERNYEWSSNMPGIDISWFAREILHKPLYVFQEEICNAILDSVLNGKGLTFTIMLARQSGKNQISAAIETYLLACMESGTIIKAAPT